jgi:hypothetical protein
MNNLKNLTAETLDAMERDLSAAASKLWDQGFTYADEMTEVVALINAIRKARTDLTAEALIK